MDYPFEGRICLLKIIILNKNPYLEGKHFRLENKAEVMLAHRHGAGRWNAKGGILIGTELAPVIGRVICNFTKLQI
jgi:hypothetical protein